eukprot:SAG31_NODE_44502_length_262_cov_1.036810_1_plen_67_part_10
MSRSSWQHGLLAGRRTSFAVGRCRCMRLSFGHGMVDLHRPWLLQAGIRDAGFGGGDVSRSSWQHGLL